MGENFELRQVVFEGGEDVHMVPRDAGEHRDMRMVEVKLGARVDGGGEVFVALEDDHRRIG